MKTINIDNVLLFHKKIVEQTGGSTGIRDKNLIESALNRAFMTFDGIDLYKSIEEKISAISFGLIKNHGFIDGNKRIGVSMMILLLKMNNIKVQYTQEELIQLGLGIAEGKLIELDLITWIHNHKPNI